MNLDIISLGEILAEIMRKDLDVPHNVLGLYVGPYLGGAPAIFIDAAAKFGAKAGFITVVGDDEFGGLALSRLRNDKVDTSHVRVARGYTTGTSFVMYYSSGERKFIFHLRHSAAGRLSERDVEEEYVSSCSFLHVMGSSLAISVSSRKACYKAVNIAKDSGATVTFDPNLRPELLDVNIIRKICKPVLEVCDVVLPSRGEAKALTGIDDPVKAGERLLEMGPRIAAIKMGDKGAIIVTNEEKIFEPAFEVSEVDPTGAGDVYDAAFVYGLFRGWNLTRTSEFASAAGAIKVTKFGPMSVPDSVKEVEDFIQKVPKKRSV